MYSAHYMSKQVNGVMGRVDSTTTLVYALMLLGVTICL